MTTSGPPGAPEDGQGPAPSRPLRAAAKRAPIVLVLAVTVTGIMANTLLNPVVPDILDAFGAPDGVAGLLVAAGAVPGILLAPFIGVAADRVGRRKVLTACLVVYSLAGVAGAAAPSLWVLIALRLAQGVGGAGLINLALVLIADGWEGTARTRMIGWNSAALTASIAVMPFVGGLLGELGWRWTFLPYGLGLLTAGWVWASLDDRGGVVQGSVRDQLRDAGAVIRQPLVAGTLAVAFATFLLVFGLVLTALPLLAEDFGLGSGARGLLLGSTAVTSTIAALLLARSQARLGRIGLVSTALGVLAVAFLLLGLAGSVLVLVVGTLLYGFGDGSAIPSLQESVASEAPPEQRGTIIAIYVAAVRAGQTVGPLVTGLGLALLDPASVFLVGAGLGALLCVGVAVLGPRVARARRAAAVPG